jgi:hypothetical protein
MHTILRITKRVLYSCTLYHHLVSAVRLLELPKKASFIIVSLAGRLPLNLLVSPQCSIDKLLNVDTESTGMYAC